MTRAVLTTEDDAELQALLRRAAAHDQAAFADLYQKTSPKFYAIISRMMGNEDSALDVLQEAYVSIWKHAGRYDPAQGRAFTWMLVIMRNRALDSLRVVARTEQTIELEDVYADTAPQPEEMAGLTSAARVIENRLSDLPAKVSEAIIMHVWYGMDYQEIGQRLATSPNTVKSWVRRGLVRLRKECPFPDLQAVI